MEAREGAAQRVVRSAIAELGNWSGQVGENREHDERYLQQRNLLALMRRSNGGAARRAREKDCGWWPNEVAQVWRKSRPERRTELPGSSSHVQVRGGKKPVKSMESTGRRRWGSGESDRRSAQCVRRDHGGDDRRSGHARENPRVDEGDGGSAPGAGRCGCRRRWVWAQRNQKSSLEMATLTNDVDGSR